MLVMVVHMLAVWWVCVAVKLCAGMWSVSAECRSRGVSTAVRGAARRWRWAGALLTWGALLVLALPHLLPYLHPALARAAPAARLLLQSEPAASTPASRDPAVDPRHISEFDLMVDSERRLPSLPLTYWNKNKNNRKKYYNNSRCAPFPSIYDLNFDNVYWQTLRTRSSGTFHLYSAYLDTRNASSIGPAVRILAVHDRIKPTLATHCQLWFEDMNAPIIVRNLEYKYIWNSKWGNYRDNLFQPYLLTCILPAEVKHLVPVSVSLVEQPCDRAVTNLRVHYSLPASPEDRKDFAVCVKGLDFQHEDLSVRLVEWIELITILGANKIFFYELQVHPNITKVLKYYTERGLVDVKPITLPGGQPNLPSLQHMYLKNKRNNKRQNEVMPYNDCLYRNMYLYRYVVLLDIDEVIVPLQDGDWHGLIDRVLPKSIPLPRRRLRTSYHVSNVYFLDSLQHEHSWQSDIPKYLHILQHVHRTRNFTKPGQYVKSFHDTERVLTLHNHLPIACLGGGCSSYAIEKSDAQLQHYRADCVRELSKKCRELSEDSVMDNSVWRWKDALVGRADAALRHLGFLQDVV